MISGNIQKNQNINDKTRNLVVGKIKDETCGVPIKSFAELKEKLYT